MTDDYMIRGNSIDDPDPWGDTPFTPTVSLQSRSSDVLNKYIKRGAERLHSELQRGGELDSVSTGWFDVEGTGYEPEPFYFLEVGPIVATAPGATWKRAFTMDHDAPEHKSEEWTAIASEFNLSSRDAEQGVPSVVSCSYAALEKATKQNEGTRAIHPRELRTTGPHVTNRAFERAMDCLAEFPGVNAPTAGGPVWVLSDNQADATTTETGESHV